MSAKIIRDAVTESSVVSTNFKLPVIDHTTVTPHNKGNFLYDVTNILYYATGSVWIPLISGLGNNLIAGFGISITAAGGNITITNTSPATSVTLSSLGGTFPLVPFAEHGPALGVMGLNVGSGITLTSDGATEVTIAAIAQAVPPMISLDPLGAGNLVPGSPQAGPYTIKGISSPDNSITIANTGTDVTLVTTTPPPAMVLTTQSFGPQGAGSFQIPPFAIDPRMWVSGGGGGGAGGNIVGTGGPGGAGAAATMQILRPADHVFWTQIGGGGAGSVGGVAPIAAGNGGDTIVGVNGSPLAYVMGGQGALNLLVNGSVYVASNNDPAQGGIGLTTPSYPPHFPADPATFPSYLIGYNGGYPNSLGGFAGSNGTAGEGIILISGGGGGGPGILGGAGGGGGGGASLSQGGAGGTGAETNISPSTPGLPGSRGSGGGGGGGGGTPPLLFGPSDGARGGDGIIYIEYWLFTA